MYLLEIVSPEAAIIHSLPQETTQMIKYCMIYDFVLIGRAEEAINIDTMSIHGQLFCRSFCIFTITRCVDIIHSKWYFR